MSELFQHIKDFAIGGTVGTLIVFGITEQGRESEAEQLADIADCAGALAIGGQDISEVPEPCAEFKHTFPFTRVVAGKFEQSGQRTSEEIVVTYHLPTASKFEANEISEVKTDAAHSNNRKIILPIAFLGLGAGGLALGQNRRNRIRDNADASTQANAGSS